MGQVLLMRVVATSPAYQLKDQCHQWQLHKPGSSTLRPLMVTVLRKGKADEKSFTIEPSTGV